MPMVADLLFREVLSDGRHAGSGSGATVLGVLAEGDAPFYAVTETSVARAY